MMVVSRMDCGSGGSRGWLREAEATEVRRCASLALTTLIVPDTQPISVPDSSPLLGLFSYHRRLREFWLGPYSCSSSLPSDGARFLFICQPRSVNLPLEPAYRFRPKMASDSTRTLDLFVSSHLPTSVLLPALLHPPSQRHHSLHPTSTMDLSSAQLVCPT
jgi:hypothetical protein